MDVSDVIEPQVVKVFQANFHVVHSSSQNKKKYIHVTVQYNSLGCITPSQDLGVMQPRLNNTTRVSRTLMKQCHYYTFVMKLRVIYNRTNFPQAIDNRLLVTLRFETSALAPPKWKKVALHSSTSSLSCVDSTSKVVPSGLLRSRGDGSIRLADSSLGGSCSSKSLIRDIY